MSFKSAADLTGLTLQQLADLLGKAPSTISAYKNGGRRPPVAVVRTLVRYLVERSHALAAEAEELSASIGEAVAPRD